MTQPRARRPSDNAIVAAAVLVGVVGVVAGIAQAGPSGDWPDQLAWIPVPPGPVVGTCLLITLCLVVPWRRFRRAKVDEAVVDPVATVAAAKASVAQQRQQAALRPGDGVPRLGAVLLALSEAQRAAGQLGDALTSGTEAHEIFGRLAQFQPDAYLAALGAATINMTECLTDVDRHDEAIAMGEEAVRMHRPLAATDAALVPSLAWALHHLGQTLHQAGRTADGLPLMEESAVLFRQLAAADATTYAETVAHIELHLADYRRALGGSTD